MSYFQKCLNVLECYNVRYRRRQWHPTPVLLPGKSMDGGAWKAAVHEVAKSRTRLSDFTFTFYFHALEKEMATHSSVLAWRIRGTGKPGELPSMGSRLSSSSSRHILKLISSYHEIKIQIHICFHNDAYLSSDFIYWNEVNEEPK